MNPVPCIPESAPFSLEQRAWLNGFIAGLLAQNAAAQFPATPPPLSAAPLEPLLLLFGSQTGSAEGLAKKAAKEARQRGFEAKILPLNDYEQANLTAGGKAVIITSTWGDGDPPDNAVNFWSWLKSESPPRLEKLQFAVLGLGDKNYSDFCGASKKFDARLADLGAARLLDRGECDTDYETAANSWLHSLWTKLSSPGRTPIAVETPPATNGHASLAAETPKSRFGKSNPFPARLLKNVPLNKPGSAKEVRHYEIGLEGSDLTYEPGDALGVAPRNCPELVEQLLRVAGGRNDDLVNAGGKTISLREALLDYYDITKPSSGLVEAVALAAPGSELSPLIAPDRSGDLKKWLSGKDVLDLIKIRAKPMAVDQWLPLLRKLTPRLYSISSSLKAHPGEVHLTVAAVRYENLGRARKGVASTFLADRADNAAVRLFVQPSHGFKLPASADTPIIMVGPGTGIAPFRAFLEEREAVGAKGGHWLFFGDQTRAADFLYEERLNAWQRSGHLTRLDLAFSRDQTDKVYVQHRMIEAGAELWAWLESGAHFYVCGDASRMAKDVDAALHTIVEQAGGKSPDDAKAYVAALKSARRYQRDVY